MEQLDGTSFEALGELAKIDHQRELRSGCPEVVFGQNKEPEDIASIMLSLSKNGAGSLATRVAPDKATLVCAALPEGLATFHSIANIVSISPTVPRKLSQGVIAVVSAGTSDRPVAEEAAITLEFLGHRVERYSDVGVAGLQRLLSVSGELKKSNVVIAIAGMEGALPTVLAGLIPCPVIAVPTSVGYGVGLGGYVAMMGMLASCAPGLTVVNIDNGFGAAVAATRMNRHV